MPLPISDFKFLSEEEIEQLDISSVPRDGDTGSFLEVSLEYPEYLHDLHNFMPLAPENLLITRDMLSDVTIEMGMKFDSKFPPTKKLCPNLYDKTKYVLHFVNLQFYMKHGMVLRKIHRVLSFKQTAWIEPYIRFNTEKRKLATDVFSKDLYKLLSNSVRYTILKLIPILKLSNYKKIQLVSSNWYLQIGYILVQFKLTTRVFNDYLTTLCSGVWKICQKHPPEIRREVRNKPKTSQTFNLKA